MNNVELTPPIPHDQAQLVAQIVNQCPSSIAVTHLDGSLVFCNQKFARTFHAQAEESIVDLFPSTFAQFSLDHFIERLEKDSNPIHVIENHADSEFLYHGQTHDWCVIKISLLKIQGNALLLFFIEDLTSSVVNNLRVNIKLETIVDHLPVLIAHVDHQDRYIFANRTYEKFFDRPLSEVIGKRVEELIGTDAYLERKPFLSRVKMGESVVFDNAFFFGDEIRLLQLKLVPGESGLQDYYIFAQDVTELRSFQKKLEYRAYHDSLTGLTNRTFFVRALRQALESKQADLGLLFIDVDGLKIANDKFGHDIGDELLKRFAHLLKNTLRPNDVVSRLAGDEFTVLLANLDEPEKNLIDICERIQATLPVAMQIDGNCVPCSCSIGATYINIEANYDEEKWLAIADTAMYRVKRQGKGGFNIHLDL